MSGQEEDSVQPWLNMSHYLLILSGGWGWGAAEGKQENKRLKERRSQRIRNGTGQQVWMKTKNPVCYTRRKRIKNHKHRRVKLNKAMAAERMCENHVKTNCSTALQPGEIIETEQISIILLSFSLSPSCRAAVLNQWPGACCWASAHHLKGCSGVISANYYFNLQR